MRRKSDRTATKKAKPSPEKKIEKVKRGRTRRRKQSTSSENESVEETNTPDTETVIEIEKKIPQTPKKAEIAEETPDQVWHVKTAEGSGDGGEIQKLKICLARPPSTPERVDRSPRSKRKHSRATSSSDTPSVEAVEDRRKSKHRSRRNARESNDEPEKNNESQDETETEVHKSEKNDSEVTQSSENVQETVPDEVTVSTTNDDSKSHDEEVNESAVETPNESQNESKDESNQSKSSAADTTVVSPRGESADDHQSHSSEIAEVSPKDETAVVSTEVDVGQSDESTLVVQRTPENDRSEIVDKSEILEIHIEDSKIESPEDKSGTVLVEQDTSSKEVSKAEDQPVVTESTKSVDPSENKINNDTDVVEGSDKTKEDKLSNSSKAIHVDDVDEKPISREFERSDSTQSVQDNTSQNGSAAPIVISRKRRWGSRPSKISTQKSITISTDVLKEIIPDVKPAEFDEVIEERKHNDEKKHHKRVELTEKFERPVLPKIVIDNTENMQQHRRENDLEDDEKEIAKARESHLASNRKISIVKENDSITARPPSPPRHKQSSILYITNLVRPFTLPQLKNLLQRTGRIEDNGFWIDKIKSKCFVKYESEDQAVETRHALHGVTWPVSNPKTLQVDFSTQEAFDKAKLNEETDNAQTSTIPGTVEDWLREQDLKRERGELEKPWERKAAMREWDVGKGDKDKEKDKIRREERPVEKRRHRTPERSPEPARKFKKKEEEAPAKLLDDLFRKTKTTPCIYWLPLSAETIAVKEEQRRQHMAEHERRLQELRRTHRRH